MGRGGKGLPDSYQLHDSESRESGAVVGAGTKMEEASDEGRRGTRGETDSEDELEEKSRYSKVKIEISWNILERRGWACRGWTR